MSVLAVVPARSGSKGIHKKNLSKVGGFSLIARAANVLHQLDWVDEKIISSDSKIMIDEGIRFGLDAPFVRPNHLSSDTASGPDVIEHAWLNAEIFYSKKFEYCLYVEPTCPLRKKEHLDSLYNFLKINKYKSVMGVSKNPAHFTPQKTIIINNNLINFIHSDAENIHSRQQIPNYYHRNGLGYLIEKEVFFKHKNVVIKDITAALVIDDLLINIDDKYELEYCNYLINNEV